MSKTYTILTGEKFEVVADSPEEALLKLEGAGWEEDDDNGVFYIESDTWIDSMIPTKFDVVPTNQTSN